MKKLFIILALVMASVVVQAQQTITATLAANAITNVLKFPVTVNEWTVQANAATAVTANLVDGTTNSLVYTVPAYTYYVKTPALSTNIYTNYYGVFETNAYVALSTTTNNVSSSSALLPIVTSASAAASGSITISDVNYRFWNGVTITNSSAASMTVTLRFVR